MRHSRGKRTAMLSGAMALMVLVAAGIAMKDRIHEEYWIWRLRHSDSEWENVAAAKKLGELRSVRAVPEIVRAYYRLPPISGAGHTAPSEIRMALVQIGEPAVPALLSAITSDSASSWYVAGRVIPRILFEDHPKSAALLGRLADTGTLRDFLRALCGDQEVTECVRVAAASALKRIESAHPYRGR